MLTPEAVAAWTRTPATDADLLTVVDVVNVFVESDCPAALRTTTTDPDTGSEVTGWATSTILGATMLAARLLRRRNSPNGVEALTETGAAFVARFDPDIGRLLRIDGYAPPQVG